MYLVVVRVMFKQSRYSGVERNGKDNYREVEVMLALTNPSSSDIIVKVENRDVTATGMLFISLSMVVLSKRG